MIDIEDARQVGLDLNKLLKISPSTYYYIKGYIHCAVAVQDDLETEKNNTEKETNSEELNT